MSDEQKPESTNAQPPPAGPLHYKQMQAADVAVLDNGDGHYNIVKSRFGNKQAGLTKEQLVEQLRVAERRNGGKPVSVYEFTREVAENEAAARRDPLIPPMPAPVK